MIKYLYLTQKWALIDTDSPGQSITGSNDSSFAKALGLDPHHKVA